MDVQPTNAGRFITAYNVIDQTLRALYDLKKSLTFTDVIRKSVMFNSVVRRYEDDLLDYGRLRNAIIHRSNSNYIIAEPHDDVVEKFESLADIISTPPLAVDRISNREVITMRADTKIADLIMLIARSGYSNIPIYEGDTLIGIANGQRILDLLGHILDKGKSLDEFIKTVSIGEIMEQLKDNNYYAIADNKLTIEGALSKFENNRKLLTVLITQNGKYNSPPIGIITVSDVVEMQSILNIY